MVRDSGCDGCGLACILCDGSRGRLFEDASEGIWGQWFPAATAGRHLTQVWESFPKMRQKGFEPECDRGLAGWMPWAKDWAGDGQRRVSAHRAGLAVSSVARGKVVLGVSDLEMWGKSGKRKLGLASSKKAAILNPPNQPGLGRPLPGAKRACRSALQTQPQPVWLRNSNACKNPRRRKPRIVTDGQ